MKVKIYNNDLKTIREYTNKVYKFFNAQGRPNSTIINNIFVGKLGEFAFKKIFKDRLNDVDFEIRNSDDGGFDFLIDNKLKIDVKTLRKESFSRVFFNSKYMHSDFYALMRIIDKTNEYLELRFEGFLSKDLMKKMLKRKLSNNNEVTFVDSYLFKKDIL